jgi:hypothetical protein
MDIYEDCKIYGPYIGNTDGRKRVVIIFPNKRRKTVSYPKFIMEKHLGRYLNNNETVDHIDRNINNNDVSNLQIINRKDHSELDVKRIKDVLVNCSYCNKEFLILGKNIRNHQRKNNLLFCSDICKGLYATDIQNNKIVNILENDEKIKRDYYNNKQISP